MGTTYANITLKGPKARDILHELGNQGRCAFVSPTEDGLTTVYEMDSDEGEIRILTDLAEDLSGYFGCSALAVQAVDEELFRYWLYADGELLDTYRSPAPSLDGEGRSRPRAQGGKAELLSQYFNSDASSEEINEILHCPDHDCGFTLAVDRHLSLVELLGLPMCSVGYGFCDLDSGEFPEDLDEEDLLHVESD
ncbi:MAG: hypothetical protein EOL86_01075 [Deltaproteobacteria bacterium]|nr:hypothetical protein [Deltaproteobacteria bacterium]